MKKQLKAAAPPAASPIGMFNDHTRVAVIDTDSASVHVYRYPDGKQAMRLHFRSGHDRLYEDFFHHCVVSEADLFGILLASVQLLGATRFKDLAAAATGDPLNFQDFGVKAVHVPEERRAAPRERGSRLKRRPKALVSARKRPKGVTRG